MYVLLGGQSKIRRLSWFCNNYAKPHSLLIIFIAVISIIGRSRLCSLTPLGTLLAYFHAELRSRLYCWRLNSVIQSQVPPWGGWQPLLVCLWLWLAHCLWSRYRSVSGSMTLRWISDPFQLDAVSARRRPLVIVWLCVLSTELTMWCYSNDCVHLMVLAVLLACIALLIICSQSR